MISQAEVAIFIKTFYRDEALYECVESIEKYCRNIAYRLYIADDGEVTEVKAQFYKRLRSEGHLVLELPFNTGASKSRNKLLDCLNDEKYILRMDDDFCFCQQTNLYAMKHILEKDSSIGAVADLEIQMGIGKGSFSGQTSSWQGFAELQDKKLYIRLIPLKKFEYQCIDGIRYAKCSFSRNMLLIRKEIFEKVRWDENLKFKGEHLDFLLQIKSSGWELAFTTDSTHIHREDIKFEKNFAEYKKIKSTNCGSEAETLYSKWGISKIIKKRTTGDLIKACLAKIFRKLRLGY